VRLEGNVSFVSTDQVKASAEKAGVDAATTDEIVDEYADAQLLALKTGLLIAGLLACAAFLATGSLPSRAPPDSRAAARSEEAVVAGPAV
jgi:hypothetical protein